LATCSVIAITIDNRDRLVVPSVAGALSCPANIVLGTIGRIEISIVVNRYPLRAIGHESIQARILECVKGNYGPGRVHTAAPIELDFRLTEPSIEAVAGDQGITCRTITNNQRNIVALRIVVPPRRCRVGAFKVEADYAATVSSDLEQRTADGIAERAVCVADDRRRATYHTGLELFSSGYA